MKEFTVDTSNEVWNGECEISNDSFLWYLKAHTRAYAHAHAHTMMLDEATR